MRPPAKLAVAHRKRPSTAAGDTTIRTEVRVRGLILAPFAILVALIALTPGADLRDIGSDLPIYLDYGRRLLGGSVPYRDFALEYPPFALVPMSLPVLAWPFGTPSFEPYAWLFTIGAGLLAVAAAWLVRMLNPDRPVGPLATWLLLVVIASTSMAWRYDLWPAVLVLAGIAAAERGRPGLAGVALGVGAMMKIFPIVIVPVLAALYVARRDGPSLGRLVLGTAVATVPILLVTLALAGGDALHWLTYQLDRGLQIESVGAGALLLLHAAVGHPLSIVNAYSSVQVVSPGADVIVAATPVVEALLVVAVGVLAFRRFRRDVARTGETPARDLVTAAVAILVALIVSSKVFSIQYVVWFLPLVPLLPVSQRWLVIATAAVSAVVYPLNYTHLWQLDPLMTVVLDVRNALLLILLGWLCVSLARDPRASERPSVHDVLPPMTHGTP